MKMKDEHTQPAQPGTEADCEEGSHPAKGPQDDRGTPHGIENPGQPRLHAGRYHEDAQDAGKGELPARFIHLRGTDQQE